MVKVIVLRATKSVRKKLTVAFIFTTFIISILYGVLVYNAMKHTEDDILDRRIKQEAQYFIQQYQVDKTTARLPESIGLKSYLSSSPDLPVFLKNQPIGRRELHEQELHVGVVEIPGSDELLYLSLNELSSSNLENELSSLFLILFTVGILITTIGLLIGLFFSRVISRPIILLTKDVENDARNPLQPFYGSNHNDEVGALSQSFTKLVVRLQGFLEREKQFTRYASHELRTPISLIKNSVAVLNLSHQDNQRKKRNLGRIESAAVELESLVDTFLTLGREKIIVEKEIDLIGVVRQNLERNQLVNESKKLDIQLIVVSEPRVIKADNKLVDILIDNIVRNIYAHGASKARITVSHESIVFENNTLDRTQVDAIETEPRQSYGMEIVHKLAQKCSFELTTTVKKNTYSICLTHIS